MPKIWKGNNNQAFVTIPKALFDALGWKHGDIVKIEILGKNKIKMEKLDKINYPKWDGTL